MNWLRSAITSILSLRRRWLGMLVGIVVWLAWMLFGLWATILLVVLAAVGYVVGRVFEENESWKKIVDKLLSDRFGD